MTLLTPLPQLWVFENLDIEGVRSPDYDWIVLVTGIRVHDENHASYSVWYVATGKDMGLGNRAIFNKCI